MSTTSARLPTSPLDGRWLRALAAWAFAAVIVVVIVGGALVAPQTQRWLIAAAIAAALGLLVVAAPRGAIFTFLVYIVAQGFLRRILPSTDFLQQLGDPLLLVSPAVAVMLTVRRLRERNRAWTAIDRTILGLQGLLLLSVVNPLGGGPVNGLQQFLLVGVPMLWLYAAGTVGWWSAARFRHILMAVVALGLVAGFYADFQVSHGFPSWDQRSIDESGLTSLNIGGYLRPFSSFSAASDYGVFMQYGFVAAFILALGTGTRLAMRPVWALSAVILFQHVFATGSRGPVVEAAAAVALITTCLLRLPAVAGYGLMIAGAVVGLKLVSKVNVAPVTDTTSAAAARQLEGLQDPFGQDSTLPGHIHRLLNGVVAGLKDPIGTGVGHIGLSGGTETAYGDLGLALGVLGLVVAFVFAALLIREAFRRDFVTRADPRRLWLVGLSALPFGPDVTAGNYATIALFYLLLGASLWPAAGRPADDGVDDSSPVARAERTAV